eukprot:684969_1
MANGGSGNEILTLCVGKCGIFTGKQYYSTIMNEHQLDIHGKWTGNVHHDTDKQTLHKINTYFKHNPKSDRYIPRSMFIDIDESTLDEIRTSYLASLLDTPCIIGSGYNQPSVLFPKGYSTNGLDLIDTVMDTMRKEIESCDTFEGIHLIHAISGGWGSGFGSLLLSRFADDYPRRSTFSTSLFPSIRTSSRYWYSRSSTSSGARLHAHHNSNIEIYNTVFAINELMDTVDLMTIIDNGRLLYMAQSESKCNMEKVTYNDLNWLCSLVLSGITSPLRFSSQPSMCSNLKRMDTHFRLFPRLRFLTVSHSPWFHPKSAFNEHYTKIVQESIDGDVSGVKIEDGKLMSYAMFYRGMEHLVWTDHLNKYVHKFNYAMRDDFVTWIPNPFQSCQVNDGGFQYYKQWTPLITTSVVNQTATKSVFQMLSASFNKLCRGKSHMHLYKKEGMEKVDFSTADRHIRDLVTLYQDKQDAVIDLDDDDDEEDSEDDDDDDDDDSEDY